MVEGMSVVVNEMLSLMREMSLPLIGTHSGEVMFFGCVCFMVVYRPGFLNCDDICMCVVNKQFELLEFAVSVFLCCVCGHVVVFALYVRLSWYPMWMRWLL